MISRDTLVEQIFLDGSSYFNQLLADINEARDSIDMEVYIFSRDLLGKKVAHALASAARRGVHVRLLVDGAGAPAWSGRLFHDMESACVEMRIFHPFPWETWHWGRSVVKLPLLAKMFFLLLKINSRNHRKTCVIDHRIAYIGSINVDHCHLTKSDGGEGWRDTAVRITGQDLAVLSTAFECAWTYRSIRERLRSIFHHRRQQNAFFLNYTRHRRRIAQKIWLKRIEESQQRIWITNAYFVPNNRLLLYIVRAAKRGIDVKILLPQKSDVTVMPWASMFFYFKLLQHGVRIFEYDKTVLHAKTLIIDDWMVLGSSNLNHRSILHDLEVDVQVCTESAKQVLSLAFLNDLNDATEITLANWRRRPWYQRAVGRILLFIKYWI